MAEKPTTTGTKRTTGSTRTARTPGTPGSHPARGTQSSASSVEAKIKGLRDDVTAVQAGVAANAETTSSLGRTVATHHRLMTDPNAKGSLPRNVKGTERAHQRITVMGQKMGAKLNEISLDVEDLKAAVEVAKVGGQKAFINQLRKCNVPDVKIGEVLMVMNPDGQPFDFTDAEFIAEFFSAFAVLQSTVDEHGVTIADHTRRLDGHTERLDGHSDQIADIADLLELAACTQVTTSQQVTGLRQDVDAINARFALNPLAFGVAFLVALTFFVVKYSFWAKHTGPIYGTGAKAHTQTGTFVSTTDFANALGWSILVFIMALLIMTVFNVRYVKKATNTNQAGQQNQNQGQNNTPAQNGQNNGTPATNTNPNPGQVPPAPAANTTQHEHATV